MEDEQLFKLVKTLRQIIFKFCGITQSKQKWQFSTKLKILKYFITRSWRLKLSHF